MRPTMLTAPGFALLLLGVAAALAVFYWLVYRQESRQTRPLTGGQRRVLRLVARSAFRKPRLC